MFSIPPNFMKSTSIPYFGILSIPIGMKKPAPSNATLRIV